MVPVPASVMTYISTQPYSESVDPSEMKCQHSGASKALDTRGTYELPEEYLRKHRNVPKTKRFNIKVHAALQDEKYWCKVRKTKGKAHKKILLHQ